MSFCVRGLEQEAWAEAGAPHKTGMHARTAKASNLRNFGLVVHFVGVCLAAAVLYLTKERGW